MHNVIIITQTTSNRRRSQDYHKKNPAEETMKPRSLADDNHLMQRATTLNVNKPPLTPTNDNTNSYGPVQYHPTPQSNTPTNYKRLRPRLPHQMISEDGKPRSTICNGKPKDPETEIPHPLSTLIKLNDPENEILHPTYTSQNSEVFAPHREPT